MGLQLDILWHVTDETLAFRAVDAGIEASRSHSFVCDAHHTHIIVRIPRKGLQTDVLIVMLSGSKHEPQLIGASVKIWIPT